MFRNRPEKRTYKRKPYNGVVPGIVTNNEDPKNMGRVKAVVPSILGENHESHWALPAVPFEGTQLIPRPGDPVWVAFKGGDLNQPIYFGTWYRKDVLPEPDNLQKHFVYFWDKLGEPYVISVDPEKQEIFIQNGEAQFKIWMKEKELAIQNKDETGKAVMKDSGEITVEATNLLDIQVQGNTDINVTGTVNVTAPTVNIDSPDINLAGGGPAVARVGDPVKVNVSWTSSAGSGTFDGEIVDGSSKVNSG